MVKMFEVMFSLVSEYFFETSAVVWIYAKVMMIGGGKLKIIWVNNGWLPWLDGAHSFPVAG
jgi:hypothetical protein